MLMQTSKELVYEDTFTLDLFELKNNFETHRLLPYSDIRYSEITESTIRLETPERVFIVEGRGLDTIAKDLARHILMQLPIGFPAESTTSPYAARLTISTRHSG